AGHRDIHDLIGSFICHGTFTRFPGLKVASVENGSDWVGPLLDRLAHVHGQIPQQFDENPIEVFRRNVWVSPFWEAAPPQLRTGVQPERLLCGSDSPHPEGLAEPLEYLEYVKELDPAVVRRIMSSNAYALVGAAAANRA